MTSALKRMDILKSKNVDNGYTVSFTATGFDEDERELCLDKAAEMFKEKDGSYEITGNHYEEVSSDEDMMVILYVDDADLHYKDVLSIVREHWQDVKTEINRGW